MTVRAVPTLHGDNVTSYQYDVLFDMLGPSGEEEYRLAFAYNQRMDRWVLSIFDSRDQPVVVGAPVLLMVDLLKYAAPGLRPRGTLLCWWKTNAESAREPGEKDLGAWCEIVYFERVEDLDEVEPTEPEKL